MDITPHSCWRRVTDRAEPAPAPDIPFVLTPRERDQAAIATLYLETRRRALNARDALSRKPTTEVTA